MCNFFMQNNLRQRADLLSVVIAEGLENVRKFPHSKGPRVQQVNIYHAGNGATTERPWQGGSVFVSYFWKKSHPQRRSTALSVRTAA
jgi:hypothetical protein